MRWPEHEVDCITWPRFQLQHNVCLGHMPWTMLKSRQTNGGLITNAVLVHRDNKLRLCTLTSVTIYISIYIQPNQYLAWLIFFISLVFCVAHIYCQWQIFNHNRGDNTGIVILYFIIRWIDFRHKSANTCNTLWRQPQDHQQAKVSHCRLVSWTQGHYLIGPWEMCSLFIIIHNLWTHVTESSWAFFAICQWYRIHTRICYTFCEIILCRIPENIFNDKSTLAQVMAWCHQFIKLYYI